MRGGRGIGSLAAAAAGVTVWLLVLATVVGPVLAQDQGNRIPRDQLPPDAVPQMHNLPPARVTPAAPAVPVVPDTAIIRISVPDSLPQPLAVRVVQDTLTFGGLLHLVLDYPADTVDGPQLAPVAEGDWLLPVAVAPRSRLDRLLGRKAPPAVDTSALPAADGTRVVRSFRVYRRDPLRIAWRDELSPVLVVAGQTVGAEQTATIREPRRLDWTPWRLVLVALLLFAAAALVRWWWRRRHGPPPLAHWPLPDPAWLAAATGLQALLTEDTLARGDTGLFLDRLAALARSYVAGRYRIAAREMTGSEIVAACAALGHDPGHPGGFARLVDLADRERYNPERPDAAFCREQAVQFFGRINRVRVAPRFSPVAPEKMLAAEKAWAALVAELGTGAGRAVGAGTGGGR